LIANLKRNCFVDEDLEHLLYGYSAQPNLQLTVFGLVTSLPPPEDERRFNIYGSETDTAVAVAKADADKSEGERVESFERAFSAMFPAIQGMEKFTSFHHYPRVILHPIAVYRDIVAPREEN
jgi:hypothetical protein